MKKLAFKLSGLAAMLLCIVSCNTKEDKQALPALPQVNKTVLPSPAQVLKDYMTWYNYMYYTTQLSQTFIPLNADSVSITKTAFVDSLITGKYIPIKIIRDSNLVAYKLWRFNNSDTSIKNIVSQMASTEKRNMALEGKELPDFNFTDINGNIYNPATTKGKIVVLKCWFIHCVACVAEFPVLNKLVDDYKSRQDVVFVSLASDTKEELKIFLKKRKFKYAVVAGKGKYMQNNLGIISFPTHILFNRDGKIVKVTTTIEELIPFLTSVINS